MSNFPLRARLLTWLFALSVCNAPHSLAQQGAPRIVNAQPGAPRDALRGGWQSPPEASKPHVYWYWLNNIVTKNGISKDLEAMAKNGIGGAYIGHIGGVGLRDVPKNSLVKGFSDEWYELMQHAIREGKRTGVQIGVFNGPGWSQSGGPQVKLEESMTRIASAEVRVSGGQRFDGTVPRVEKAIADVRVIAFPAPANDGEKLKPLRVTSNQGEELGALVDAQPHVLPEKQDYTLLRLDFEFETPQTVRSLELTHKSGLQVAGTISVSQNGAQFEPLRPFLLDRRSGPATQIQVGAQPSTVSIPPTTARFFRVEMPWNTAGNGTTLGIAFSGAARVESFEEKQINVASKENTPPWNAFLWPPTPEPGAGQAIAPGQVIDLTAKMSAEGRLSWDVPAGNWIIQRLSTVPTGAGNGPAPESMSGLEIDKMSREVAARYINEGTIGSLWKRLLPSERAGFNYAIIDSYEKGPQNWTPGLEARFLARYGYDAVPFLPVLSGRVVGSAAQSDRFLWDLRRLVADLIAEDYVGGFREALRPMGLKLWIENYGHYGFPAEFLSYGGHADGIGGEFWSSGNLGPIETRDAASAAHIYGKNRVSAEAFTSAGSPFEKPGDLKMRGDWAFTQGINHYVLHVVSHQPTDVPGPGLQLLWGTYFNRNSLWFNEHGKAWVDYVRRTSYLLQQGRAVADVAYFIGEDVPQMTGILQPQLPGGYDFDWINAEVLLSRAHIKNGRLVLPGGASYRVLVLPPLETMRPQLLERISQLVKQGLNVVGPAPTRSPSLQDFPRADSQIKSLTAQLWPQNGARHRQVGLGQVWNSAPLQEVLTSLKTPPALLETNASVLWKHRAAPDAEIFFLSNQTNQQLPIAPSFRVSNRAPQIWNAETARIEEIATYREIAGRTVVPLVLEPSQSVFVVFRRAPLRPPGVVELKRDGQPVLAWSEIRAETAQEVADSNLSQSFWVKPTGEIRLPSQKLGGSEMSGQRWVVLLPRGPKVSGPGFALRGPEYAVSGVSVGRNGVAVIQRWNGNAPAVLVWKSPDPLLDWTHVLVAYRAGVPQLYIDGKFVQSGLRSGQRIIAGDEGTFEGNDSGSPFETQIRGFKTSYRALDDAQVAVLSRDRYALAVGDTRVVRVSDGSLRLQTSRAETYSLRLQNGKTWSAQVAAPPVAQGLAGPWNIEFRGAAAPPKTRWKDLQSWSEAKDEATKTFSGSAIYTTKFQLPADYNGTKTLAMFDLGRVESVARVALNGKLVGTALRTPYQLDVSSHLKAGVNELRVLVTSNWANRMIGDEQFPDDLAAVRAPNGNLLQWPQWALNGEARPEPRRITLSARRFFNKDSALQSAGLIGPVTLSFQTNFPLAAK